MSNDANKGRALVALLTARQRIDGITISELASRFAISQGYLSQLLTGEKSISTVNDSVLRKCAAYVSATSLL